MTPIVVVPSEWVLAYFFGLVVWYITDKYVEDFLVSLGVAMAYLVALTICLRIYYGHL